MVKDNELKYRYGLAQNNTITLSWRISSHVGEDSKSKVRMINYRNDSVNGLSCLFYVSVHPANVATLVDDNRQR